MVTGIIGKKVGMTQVFDPDGTVHPATVIKAGPCVVVQAKTAQTDGYQAIQLGLVEDKPAKVGKPMAGHYKKAGVPPTRVRREVRLAAGTAAAETVRGVGQPVQMQAAGEQPEDRDGERSREQPAALGLATSLHREHCPSGDRRDHRAHCGQPWQRLGRHIPPDRSRNGRRNHGEQAQGDPPRPGCPRPGHHACRCNRSRLELQRRRIPRTPRRLRVSAGRGRRAGSCRRPCVMGVGRRGARP